MIQLPIYTQLLYPQTTGIAQTSILFIRQMSFTCSALHRTLHDFTCCCNRSSWEATATGLRISPFLLQPPDCVALYFVRFSLYSRKPKFNFSLSHTVEGRRPRGGQGCSSGNPTSKIQGYTPRRSAILFELLVVNQKVVNSHYGITHMHKVILGIKENRWYNSAFYLFFQFKWILLIGIFFFHIYLKKLRDWSEA